VQWCARIFHDGYPSLVNYVDIPFLGRTFFWIQGFIVTGQGREMPTGPDHAAGPKHIVGHFHKHKLVTTFVYIRFYIPDGLCRFDAGSDSGDIDIRFWERWNDIHWLVRVSKKYRKCKLSQHFLMVKGGQWTWELSTSSCWRFHSLRAPSSVKFSSTNTIFEIHPWRVNGTQALAEQIRALTGQLNSWLVLIIGCSNASWDRKRQDQQRRVVRIYNSLKAMKSNRI
jgi:hypothetical protein